MQLTDQQLLTQFEKQTLNPQHFNHIGHLRLAWLYLKQYEAEIATQKICSGIKTYAEHLGAHDKFHFTITKAMILLIKQRMREQDNHWQAFIEQHPLLVDNSMELLSQYFTQERLFSPQARTQWLSPDIKPLD